jgi:putative pyruvate formate lyase activating enzyme
LGDEPEKINYTSEELSEEIIKVQSENVASISFITGVLYIDDIVRTIKLAKERGLRLPIVYNSSGYETVSQIKKLDGLVDIYLPDFKYFDNELGKKLSGVPNYVDVAKKCIEEMHRQVCSGEKCQLSYKAQPSEPALIVRQLVLPGHTENSKQVIKYLYETYGDDICISIMSQYTPMLQNEGIEAFPELTRKLTEREYEKVVDFALKIGVKNAFIQEGDVAKESFIPDF